MRENGYYWVVFNGKWMVAEWCNTIWSIPGRYPYYFDYSFESIDEKRLTHE